ncbi:hypothetical protein BDR06DRAFT_973898 [Suillus hirtellus]|nr:hypothetical protein BDR06DRAFT_973898 [Suillus hirtellus]
MWNNSPSIGSGSFVSDNCGSQKEVKKLALKDLPQGERLAIKWAWKCLLFGRKMKQTNAGTPTSIKFRIKPIQCLGLFCNSLAEIAEKLVREFKIEPKDTTLSDEAHKTYMQNHRLMLLNSSKAN